MAKLKYYLIERTDNCSVLGLHRFKSPLIRIQKETNKEFPRMPLNIREATNLEIEKYADYEADINEIEKFKNKWKRKKK